MEKKSYFNLGRRLTKDEYRELCEWKNDAKNKTLRFRRFDEVKGKPNMYFLNYSKMHKDGEEWGYHPGFSKSKATVRENKKGVSLFSVERKLTHSEYLNLQQWRNQNPELVWKAGDKHPTSENTVFQAYSKGCYNGEYWIPLEKFLRLKENPSYSRKTQPQIKNEKDLGQLYNSKFNPRFPTKPNDQGKYTRFPVARRLTPFEWEDLKRWREENPSLFWRRGDTHPQKEDLVFFAYNRRSYAGENWISSKTFAIYDGKYGAKWEPGVRERKALLRKFSSRVRSSISSRFRKLGETKDKRTEEIIGLSFEDFKSYIESKFEPWMNWDNYGNHGRRIPTEFNKTWHLDHIIPTSIAENEWEVTLLNHYTNFSPLCARENCFIKRDNPDYYAA